MTVDRSARASKAERRGCEVMRSSWDEAVSGRCWSGNSPDVVREDASVIIRVLGTSAVDGAPPLARRERVVLAVLALAAPDAVPPSRLADALWGERTPATWTKVVQASVVRLRQLLGVSAIETSPAGYRLVLPAEDIDCSLFASMLERASLPATATPGIALALLDDARRLWRGAAFADLDEWVDAVGPRHRLTELRHQAELMSAELLHDAGRPGEAVVIARGVAHEQPLNERGIAVLAMALYSSGRHVEALDEIHRLGDRLREELGLTVGRELAALEVAILRHDIGRHGEPAPSRRPDQSASVLIGREAENTAVIANLRPGRVVTIAGYGGVGKTTLAKHVAEHLAGTGHVVASVPLADVRGDMDAVARAIGVALGIHAPGASPTRALLDALLEQRILIVLDNAEHLRAPTAELVRQLLHECPDVSVLATSRQPLGLASEHVVRLTGLGIDEAVTLFQRCVARRGVEPGSHIELERELCARLEGLPLAIELAAARRLVMSMEEVLDAVENHLTTWQVPRERRPDRHRTMAATFEWSFALLDAPAQSLLQRLSVLPAGATMTTLAAITDGDEALLRDAIETLIDSSLLTRTDELDRSRFRLHPTTRSLAVAQLRAAGGSAAAEQSLLRCVHELSASLRQRLEGRDEERCRLEVVAERANIVAAIDIALSRQQPMLAADICAAVSTHAIYALDLGLRPWFESTVAACDAAKLDVSGLRGSLCLVRWLDGDLRGAAELAQQIARDHSDDDIDAAFALHVEGLISGSLVPLRRAVELADASGWTSIAVAFRVPLVLALAEKSPDDAHSEATIAWHLAGSSANPSNIASAHLSAGIAQLKAQPVHARAQLETARSIASAAGNQMLTMMSNVLDSMVAPLDPLVAAEAALDAARRLADHGARTQTGFAMLRAAEMIAVAGDTITARSLAAWAEFNGLDDWQQLRTTLRLHHLDIGPVDFPPYAPNLDAAIADGRASIERLRTR